MKRTVLCGRLGSKVTGVLTHYEAMTKLVHIMAEEWTLVLCSFDP